MVSAAAPIERIAWERTDTLILIALGVLTAVRAIFASQIGLADDEAYYRSWSLAPSFGYYDHAPMVAWVIAAGRAVLGDTEIGVRLVAVVSSLIGALALWRAATLLFGQSVGRLAVVFAAAMPLLGAGAIIVTPDTPSTLFTILGLWALAELYRSGNACWWLAVGLFAGFGLLSKYTNLFFGATILIWLIAVPENRRYFFTWQLWAGGVLAVLLFLPVVHWNAQHDWVSFAKQFGRVGQSKGFGLGYLGEFLGAILLLASPVIAVLAFMGLQSAFRSAWQRRESAHVLLIASVVPLFAYFLQHALHDRVQANWPAPLYPSLAVAAALGVAYGPWREARARLVPIAAGLGFLMTVLLYAHATHPLMIVAGKREATHQLHGWGELAAEAERLARQKGAHWIATESYATTAQLAFHLDRRIAVLQLDERARYVHFDPPSPDLVRQPALFVDLERRVDRQRLAAMFERVEDVAVIERRARGVAVATYKVLLLADSKADPLTDVRLSPTDQVKS